MGRVLLLLAVYVFARSQVALPKKRIVEQAGEFALREFYDADNKRVIELGVRSTPALGRQATNTRANGRPNGINVKNQSVLFYW